MHLFDLETKMYEREIFAGNKARHIVLGGIFELCVNIGPIHAINNLILSNIVGLNNYADMIKAVRRLP
jgi:hypothetical protein